MHVVPDSPPEPIDAASIKHPVERNHGINQSYYEMGRALLAYMGSPYLSNWCTFGQFASRQVGEWIRGLTVSWQTVSDFLTLPARIGTGAVERAVGDLTGLPRQYAMFEPLLALAMRRVGVKEQSWCAFLCSGGWRGKGPNFRERMVAVLRALKELWSSLQRVQDNLVRGNLTIYLDIAPILCRFLRSLAEAHAQGRAPAPVMVDADRDPCRFLSEGLALYRQVYLLGQAGPSDPGRDVLRGELMHRANLLLGCQEQLLILQPIFEQMREELLAMSPTMTLADPHGHHKLLPRGGDWGDFYQRMGMRPPPPSSAPRPPQAQEIPGLLLAADSPEYMGTIGEYFARGLADTHLHQRVSDVFPLARGEDPSPQPDRDLPYLPTDRTYWHALLSPASYEIWS